MFLFRYKVAKISIQTLFCVEVDLLQQHQWKSNQNIKDSNVLWCEKLTENPA